MKNYFNTEINSLLKALGEIEYDLDSVVDDYHRYYGEEDGPYDTSVGKLEDIANFLREKGVK